MELRVLTYFLTVAREENFTRAAEQLHVTQPTLSRQIADLEAELGVKLFTRSSHNIILTEDGMLLKRRAQEIVALAERTKQDFLFKEENIEGTVTIGSGEFLSTRILTDCIAAFRRKYPLVRYELYSGHADNIRESIERGLLDIGLVAEPIDIRKYEFVSMPVKERWGALVREDSPLAAREYITPQDLTGLPVISPVSNIAESNVGKWFGAELSRIDVIAGESPVQRGAAGAEQCRRGACDKAGLQLRWAEIHPVFSGAGELHRADMEEGAALLNCRFRVYELCKEIHLKHI